MTANVVFLLMLVSGAVLACVGGAKWAELGRRSPEAVAVTTFRPQRLSDPRAYTDHFLSPTIAAYTQKVLDAFGVCGSCGKALRRHKSRHNADPSRRAVCP